MSSQKYDLTITNSEIWDQCFINPFKYSKSKNILSNFQQLRSWPEFQFEILDSNCVLRYIVAMYDRHSPVFTRFDKVEERKIYAALLAGWEPDGQGQFAVEVKTILSCLDPKVMRMIIRYCRMQHSSKWILFTSYNEAIYKPGGLMERAMNGDIEISKLQRAVEEVDRLQQDILSEDNNRNLTETMFEVIDEDEMSIIMQLLPEGQKEVLKNEPVIVEDYDENE